MTDLWMLKGQTRFRRAAPTQLVQAALPKALPRAPLDLPLPMHDTSAPVAVAAILFPIQRAKACSRAPTKIEVEAAIAAAKAADGVVAFEASMLIFAR